MNIVTISRGTLSGTQLLSDYLAKELGLPVFHREKVFEEAEKYAIRETGFCDISFVDRAPSIWERQFYRRKHYLLSFQVALLDLALNESCIYEGHLGQYLLTGVPFLLRLRVVQSEETRIRTMMLEHKINYEQAEIDVRLIDERRRQWSEYLYGVNYEDQHFYDLIINLDVMSIQTAAEIIKAALKRPEFTSSDESMQILNNLHLASKAKLFLYLSPVTRGIEVDVDADSFSGEVIIKGISHTMDTDKYESYIKSVLGKIPEIGKIIFK